MSNYKLNQKAITKRKSLHISESKIICLLGFLLPFLMSLIICIKNGVYPFGQNCILHVDMYHQYEPFFTELMDKLKTGGSLFYSMRIGLGSDFISLMAYYLASPVNWLLVLCPSAHVIEFMTIVILVKIGLCGFTFTYYLKSHFQKNDYAIPLFASFYAMSSYMAAYSWDIMWLDCLVLAPLILLGLEKLVRDKKPVLFCTTLAVSILSNFYISIMICIFVVFYFFILLFEENDSWKQRVATTGRFTLYSLLAGGMGAILLIPEAIILGYSGSSNISIPDKITYYFSLVNELARHFFGVEVYLGRDHWPNLYAGAAIFLFFVLYILNKNISWTKKIKRVLFIAFFWVSFSNNLLDYIWHGLHFPDSLPGRQSFLYIFLLLVLAYEAYTNRAGNNLFHLIAAAGVSIGGAVAIGIFSDSKQLDSNTITMTIMLIVLYAVIYGLLLVSRKENSRAAILSMLGVLAVMEVYANFDLTGLSTTSRTAYTSNWDSVKSLMSEVEQSDSSFFRTEETERLTKNDAAIYGYRSSTIFSSLMNVGVADFFRKLGMEGGKNFYSYSGATPITSAMLSVKYLISNDAQDESPLRTLVAGDDKNYIYENKYTLPLGYMVDSGLEKAWKPSLGIPIDNLNKLSNLLGASESMLTKLDSSMVKIEDKQTVITVPSDMYLYGTYTDTSVTNITVTNGDRIYKFSKADHGYILDLGWCRAGDTIVITNTPGASFFNVVPYVLDLDAVQTAYNTLNKETLQVTSYSDTKITGTVTAEKAGDLIVSIPSEDGWKVTVDGKRVTTESFLNSLIKIPLEAGTHEISLRYVTPGLWKGTLISGSCLLVFMSITFIRVRKSRKGR